MGVSDVLLDTPMKWKAASHPLRLGILRLLADGEMTNEELARQLEVASGKLYFHTKKLLEAGLIEAAPTRIKGSLIEKPYRRVSDGFIVPMVEDGTAPPLLHLLVNAAQLYQSTWAEATNKHFIQFGYHVMYFQTAEKEAEYYERINQLASDFIATAVPASHPDARIVSMGLLAHRCPNRSTSENS